MELLEPPATRRSALTVRAREHALAMAAVTLATSVSWLIRQHVDLADIAMIELVAIAAAAAALGRGLFDHGIVLAVAAFDFFFVPPIFTFHVEELRHVLTFAVMLGAGIRSPR